jgi:hypothetical protein
VGRNGAEKEGKVITQLVEMDCKLIALKLWGYGSIYLKQDLPETSGIPLSTDPSLSEYRLGPSVQRSWWAEERKAMPINRGPCTSRLEVANDRDAGC